MHENEQANSPRIHQHHLSPSPAPLMLSQYHSRLCLYKNAARVRKFLERLLWQLARCKASHKHLRYPGTATQRMKHSTRPHDNGKWITNTSTLPGPVGHRVWTCNMSDMSETSTLTGAAVGSGCSKCLVQWRFHAVSLMDHDWPVLTVPRMWYGTVGEMADVLLGCHDRKSTWGLTNNSTNVDWLRSNLVRQGHNTLFGTSWTPSFGPLEKTHMMQRVSFELWAIGKNQSTIDGSKNCMKEYVNNYSWIFMNCNQISSDLVGDEYEQKLYIDKV